MPRSSTRATSWSGGQPAKRAKKVKQTALCKVVQEHWDALPDALKTQCEALGVPPTTPPPPQDLPSLIKEHLQPSTGPESCSGEDSGPGQARTDSGALRQLTNKKAAIQSKADAVKAQYTSLLQELKELQGKIESAQKDLQQATTLYNKQLEEDKQATAEAMLTLMS